MDLPVPSTIAAELGLNVLSQTEFLSTKAPEISASKKEIDQILDDEPTLANEINSFMFEDDVEVDPQIPVDYSEVPTGSFFLQDISTPPPAQEIGMEHREEPPTVDKSRYQPQDAQTIATLKAIEEIQSDFATIANKINKAELIHTDGRFPCYVIFTSRKNLTQKYGENTASVVIDAMRDLALKLVSLPGWNGCVFVPDDAQSTQEFGLTPITTADAWKLKLSLVDLDKVLASRGEMIGALLIVGGDDIVPFHLLPNPTDDSDLNVPQTTHTPQSMKTTLFNSGLSAVYQMKRKRRRIFTGTIAFPEQRIRGKGQNQEITGKQPLCPIDGKAQPAACAFPIAFPKSE